MTTSNKTTEKQGASDMERVYARLFDMIVKGRIGQGVRLVERDLASQFGTSRTPVREAIKRMEQDGLVERNKADRYARPVVASLSEQEMEELHEIVASLEALAAKRCASLPAEERKSLAGRLRKLNRTYARICCAKPFDIERAVEADHQFHSAYIELGSGPRVAAMRRSVKPQTERYVRTFLPAFVSRLEESVSEHEAIIAAIAAGEESAADDAVRKNWGNAAKRIGDAMALWNPSPGKGAG